MPLPPGIFPAKRQSAFVYTTAAQLRQEPSPTASERYAIVLELGPDPFAWTLYSVLDDDGINVIAPTGGGGATGRWIRSRSDDRTLDLPDGDETIAVTAGRTRVLPASTLTQNSVLTLDDAGAVGGDEFYIVRNDVGAFTYTIVNGGAGAGNVAVMPVSQRAWCLARFDGTNWIHLGSSIALATS